MQDTCHTRALYTAQLTMTTDFAPCKVLVIRIRNPENFACGIRNPETFLLVEYGIVGFGIQNSAQGIRTPLNDWNTYPESRFHWYRIRNPVPAIRNPQREIQNARLSPDCLGLPHTGRQTVCTYQTSHLIPNSASNSLVTRWSSLVLEQKCHYNLPARRTDHNKRFQHIGWLAGC